MDDIQIRRRILQLLYQAYNRDPHGAVEQDELAQDLNLPPNRVQCNLAYLSHSDKKLVKLTETSAGGSRIYRFAQITPLGIDLLDKPSEFNKTFPPQVIYQYVAGDYVAGDKVAGDYVAGDKVEATIGDNASEVIVGKDIFKLQFGTSHNLEEVCTRFVTSLESHFNPNAADKKEESTTQLEKLRALLQCEEPDLGEVQRIKRFLTEIEGWPAVGTMALFGHPAVVEPIQQAVERLIGRS